MLVVDSYKRGRALISLTMTLCHLQDILSSGVAGSHVGSISSVLRTLFTVLSIECKDNL